MPSLDLFGETKQNGTMAITRAQQAKQMLREGGRIGLKGGADAATESFAESYDRAVGNAPGTTTGRADPQGGFDLSGGQGPTFDGSPPTTGGNGGGDNNNNIVDEVALTGGKKTKVPPKKPKKTKDNTLPTLNTAEKFRLFTLKKLYDRKMGLTPNVYGVVPNLVQATQPPELNFYEESDPMFDAAYYGMSGEDITDADRLAKTINEAEKTGNLSQTEFEDAFFGPDGPPETIDRDGPDQVMDPCKGPNPPAYCFIDKEEKETPPIDPIFYRIMAEGGMTDDAPMIQGGITDLALRDEFFLGGVVKGIKKGLKGVTRAVKKIAKSPIGKAALLAAPFAFNPGSVASFFGKGSFSPFMSKSGLSGLGSILNKIGAVDAAGKLTAGGIIGGLTTIPFIGELLGLNKQDEQVVDRGPGVDFNAQQYYRLAADGGLMRQQYQEGSKEPVAKKTMPLIDMGGKEKDYRETGGFVDMGRMEKADDVPARLSKNEFVFTAEAVRNAGDGDVDKGSEVMYNMMKNLESGGDVSEESQGLDGARKMFQTSQRLEEVL